MKHPKQFISTIILLCWLPFTNYAQQGNVAAGGDIIGTGGKLSYSIGQTDYLMFGSEYGSISFGLQQTFYAVPPLLEIPSTIILPGEMLCYNAEQTVIVAGNNKHFIIQAGGSAEIIAGSNIIIREGAIVETGGYLHAYISDVWCSNQISLLASSESYFITVKSEPEPTINTDFFKVYPNPTTGIFTIELLEFEESSNIQIEIFSLHGHLIRSEVIPEKQFKFNLTERQPGIYIIRVYKDNEVGFDKIIRN
jgi:hypothetical protein